MLNKAYFIDNTISTYGLNDSNLSKFGSLHTIRAGEGYLARHITFIDTIKHEDTITVHKDLLENALFITEILEPHK